MVIKDIYKISKTEFDNLSIEEKYKMYLQTDTWKNISKHLRDIENKCLNCGSKFNLAVHQMLIY